MESAMNAAELRDIFSSSNFKKDLGEISSYLASIAVETPVVHCLAKQLWKSGNYKYQVEAKRQDLVVDGKRLEVKSSYDFTVKRLEGEVQRYGVKACKEMWQAALAQRKSIGWSIMLKIYEDVCQKVPATDIFIWVLCARDLSKLEPEDRKRTCMYKPQLDFNLKYGYADQSYLKVVDDFLEELTWFRSFSVLKTQVKTKGDFPSVYSFRICEFAS
jgi:hypothetical protein